MASRYPQRTIRVDREKTTPFLLRVFYKAGGHNREEDYVKPRVPEREVQVYTWMDASVREITQLVQEVVPDARKKGCYLGYAVVYPDRFGKPVVKETLRIPGDRRGQDDDKTLDDLRLQIGDYMDVALYQ